MAQTDAQARPSDPFGTHTAFSPMKCNHRDS